MFTQENSGARPAFETASGPHLEAAAPARAGCPARPEPDSPLWDALAPRGFHARHGRRVLACGLALASLLPAACLSLPIALVTAWEHGPAHVLFRQERVGWRGRSFRMLKFRTLRAGEDDTPADARASRFGRFLRRTHLDELPQLVNVLRGEMDLVGPRPETLAIDAWARAHVPGFYLRNVVRPGLSGLAQVTQGYAEPEVSAYEEKLRLDRRYLERPTLAADVALLARTLAWVLRARGAQAWPRGTLRPQARRR
ncbi:MAG: sugar transferase [Planctomycetota bacterium]